MEQTRRSDHRLCQGHDPCPGRAAFDASNAEKDLGMSVAIEAVEGARRIAHRVAREFSSTRSSVNWKTSFRGVGSAGLAGRTADISRSITHARRRRFSSTASGPTHSAVAPPPHALAAAHSRSTALPFSRPRARSSRPASPTPIRSRPSEPFRPSRTQPWLLTRSSVLSSATSMRCSRRPLARTTGTTFSRR